MNSVPLDPSSIVASARAVGVELEPGRVPVIEAGLAAVGAATLQAALPLDFEAEPSGFDRQREAHAQGEL